MDITSTFDTIRQSLPASENIDMTRPMPSGHPNDQEAAVKPCPFCAEPIQEAAIKCRHCGTEQELSAPFGRCVCGTMDLELVAGEELRIRELEVNHVRDLRVLGDRR